MRFFGSSCAVALLEGADWMPINDLRSGKDKP